MNRPSILLLLALVTFSSSFPIDPQTSANRFYGQIFEKYFAEAYEELFDFVFAKFNSFLPGLIQEDDVAAIKKEFIDFLEKEGAVKNEGGSQQKVQLLSCISWANWLLRRAVPKLRSHPLSRKGIKPSVAHSLPLIRDKSRIQKYLIIYEIGLVYIKTSWIAPSLSA
ncbi:hypothetical protein PMAYCL1PPCAC_28087, partial [Pristionchus mayeri]